MQVSLTVKVFATSFLLWRGRSVTGSCNSRDVTRRPWSAGRLVGPKAPLKPKPIWAIRQQLKVPKRVRDLAMFGCALDAKLRAYDLMKLRVSDVAPGGSEAPIYSHPTKGRNGQFPFDITGPVRAAIAAWLVVQRRREAAKVDEDTVISGGEQEAGDPAFTDIASVARSDGPEQTGRLHFPNRKICRTIYATLQCERSWVPPSLKRSMRS